MLAAVGSNAALQAWAQGPPPRHDYFEPFLDPWSGLTWMTVLALWIASATQGWAWRLAVGIGACLLAIQAWMLIPAAWIGAQDGQVGGPGGLAGALSSAQVGLAAVWIVLIVRSKRMPT
jgi:hypothetical protein